MATDEKAASVTRSARAQLLRGIYFILNEGDRDGTDVAARVLDAGVRVIQYRAKGVIVPEHVRALRKLTERRGALLIVNDDWQAAVALDCDGVHVGPGDAGFDDIASLRAWMGPDRIIGVSCGSVAEAARIDDAHAVDYAGVGAVYATNSKADAGEPIGIAGLAQIARAVSLPVAAIGGIDLSRLPAILETGVAMAAVISAISSAPDPGAAAAELTRAWSRA